MFSEPYRNVKHFGIWAEESADRYGKRDALRVLDDVCDRCYEEDMRTDYTFAALEYLAARTTRPSCFVRFKNALDILDSGDRCQQVRAALKTIRCVLSA